MNLQNSKGAVLLSLLSFSLVLIFCLLFARSAQAEMLESKAQIQDFIIETAIKLDVDVQTALSVAHCESRFNPNAVGDKGTSFGIYQIHLPAHPSVSKEEALDPSFNIRWALGKMSRNGWKMWSCYKQRLTELSFAWYNEA